MTPPLIGIGDVMRGGAIVLKDAVYSLTVGENGRITGSIKAPSSDRLCGLARPGPRLQLRLDDGVTVSFFVYRAQTAPGGWGDIEGRLEAS